MAYVAPRTWTTGELVTAALMNQDVRDNMVAVKAQVDTIYTATFSNPARAFNAEYQNLSGKIRIVIITSGHVGGNNESYSFNAENASPATVTQGLPDHQGAATMNQVSTFIVPDNWYYNTVAGAPVVTLVEWIEFDLF